MISSNEDMLRSKKTAQAKARRHTEQADQAMVNMHAVSSGGADGRRALEILADTAEDVLAPKPAPEPAPEPSTTLDVKELATR